MATTKCTTLERKLLDLLRGQPDHPTREDGDEIVKLMDKIRLGQDEEYFELLI